MKWYQAVNWIVVIEILIVAIAILAVGYLALCMVTMLTQVAVKVQGYPLGG